MKPAFDTTLDDLDFDVLLMRPQRAQPQPRLTASGFIGLASLRDADLWSGAGLSHHFAAAITANLHSSTTTLGGHPRKTTCICPLWCNLQLLNSQICNTTLVVVRNC
jgi:hypothetical protein